MNDLAPSLGQMFSFFSVNRWSKASKNFRFDSDSYASVIVVGNVCYNPNTIWTYFSCAVLLCFLFHLMKQTLVSIYVQSFLSTIKRKKINVGTEALHREASLGTY